MKELELISLIAGTTSPCEGLIRGIGDDCAVIAGSPGQLQLLTMDTLVEGVHFDLRWHPPELLGRKVVSVNVSDVAAMGGSPRFVLLSLGFSNQLDEIFYQAFLEGLRSACREYGCQLVGGDTVFSPQGLHITLTVLGEAPAEVVRYRHAALPGDAIFVTGTLGNAAAGLALSREQYNRPAALSEGLQHLVAAHLNPVARIPAGTLLAGSGYLHAMMDISDGLATDLAHICKASGVKAEVDAALLPADDEFLVCCRERKWDTLALMLGGGEDYELLCTAPAAQEKAVYSIAQSGGFRFTRIGRILEGKGVILLDKGQERDISYQGYEHGK